MCVLQRFVSTSAYILIKLPKVQHVLHDRLLINVWSVTMYMTAWITLNETAVFCKVWYNFIQMK